MFTSDVFIPFQFQTTIDYNLIESQLKNIVFNRFGRLK